MNLPPAQTLTGCWSAADRRRSAYLYLPVQVPSGVRCLTVAYRTTVRGFSGEEHTDIGLFDPRGHAPGSPGFRGWSGSARDRVQIGESFATPGYVPGPVTPGVWHVVLGSRNCDGEDLEYTVDVGFRDGPVPEWDADDASWPAPFSAGVLCPDERYYRGDLHCHTYHSDGTHPLETVAGRARERGLDFLAITNHNVVATHAMLPAGLREHLFLLGAEEVTTYRGHLNVWGIRDWIEFRAETDAEMQAILDEARRRGAVTCLNHPRDRGPDWEFAPLAAISCLEVWNAPWPVNNYEATARYDALLCAGRRMTAVGGSDIHVIGMPDAPYFYELGNPTTHVYASELSEQGLLDGLRAGRVCVTAEPREQWAELRAEANGLTAVMGSALPGDGEWRVSVATQGFEDAVVALIADGAWIACLPARDAVDVAIPAPAHYVRAEVLRERADAPENRFALAITNPVYRAMS